MGTKIGVIESKWSNRFNGIEKNITVRPLFDFFSDLHFGSHHAYDYEMVSTIDGLQSALGRFASSRAITVVYMAMHGNEKSLHLHGGESISRTILRNRILQATEGRGSNLTGLYIGSCLFLTEKLASYILRRDSSIKWIAGYKSAVDFVHSSSLDLLFFNTMQSVKIDHPNYSHRNKIIEVVRRLKVEVPGLCNTTDENGDDYCGLGLSVFVRRRGPRGGVEDILRPPIP